MRRTLACLLTLAIAAVAAPAHAGSNGDPHSPDYQARDAQNIADAYGRITGPGGQLQNPAYLPALVRRSTTKHVNQLLQQAATPNRLAITPGNVFPGWNVGNPLRSGWKGVRGRMHRVAFTNRYGALLRGHVYRPMPGARDPYTGEKLQGPYPGVVITEGSVQGSEGMYQWLAEDLAERGYVVLTYDVQGQGTSETAPHDGGPVNALPFCNPFATPGDQEMDGCPGVPSQQLSNFVVGTEDALSFFTSTPDHHYGNPQAAGADVDSFNPYWKSFDSSPDTQTDTPGRTTRIAIIGHSMGAAAVSQVQATDDRVETVVALDKLVGSGDFAGEKASNKPVVPALGIQSEYGFSVTPWEMSGGSSLQPQPSPDGPDPMRERRTGFDDWHQAGVDSMLVVPRASTHLEYTDIPLALPASRYGQDVASVYVQKWLGHYLKHQDTGLLDTSFRYLEPTGHLRWSPVKLDRAKQLSFYYCSAYSLGSQYDGDIAHVGC